MNAKLIKLFSEAKFLLPHATVEQKIKLYRLLSEAKKETEKEQNIFVNDPETEYILNYAKQKYPHSATKQQAFLKLVQRSMLHGKEVDDDQEKEIDKLEKKLNGLMNRQNEKQQDLTKIVHNELKNRDLIDQDHDKKINQLLFKIEDLVNTMEEFKNKIKNLKEDTDYLAEK